MKTEDKSLTEKLAEEQGRVDSIMEQIKENAKNSCNLPLPVSK